MNLQDLGKIFGGARNTSSSSSSEIMFTEIPYLEGVIGCVGLGSNQTNSVKYAHQFDYFFTGFDGRACKTE